jgi:hypothetical protein
MALLEVIPADLGARSAARRAHREFPGQRRLASGRERSGLLVTSVSQLIPPARRIASVNPFSESPGIPYTRRTPDAFNVATITSAGVLAIIAPFQRG